MPLKLKPVLSLKTRVIYVKKVPQGWGISYGHIYVAEKPTRIVTLPIGYGDGYPRILSNQGPVLIGGKRFKISGRVCMDQIMVDVGDAAVKVGDEAVLIGTQGKNKITTEELAGLAGTIPYEIVCGLGSRIPRTLV
jgi:alanine racemase